MSLKLHESDVSKLLKKTCITRQESSSSVANDDPDGEGNVCFDLERGKMILQRLEAMSNKQNSNPQSLDASTNIRSMKVPSPQSSHVTEKRRCGKVTGDDDGHWVAEHTKDNEFHPNNFEVDTINTNDDMMVQSTKEISDLTVFPEDDEKYTKIAPMTTITSIHNNSDSSDKELDSKNQQAQNSKAPNFVVDEASLSRTTERGQWNHRSSALPEYKTTSKIFQNDIESEDSDNSESAESQSSDIKHTLSLLSRSRLLRQSRKIEKHGYKTFQSSEGSDSNKGSGSSIKSDEHVELDSNKDDYCASKALSLLARRSTFMDCSLPSGIIGNSYDAFADDDDSDESLLLPYRESNESEQSQKSVVHESYNAFASDDDQVSEQLQSIDSESDQSSAMNEYLGLDDLHDAIGNSLHNEYERSESNQIEEKESKSLSQNSAVSCSIFADVDVRVAEKDCLSDYDNENDGMCEENDCLANDICSSDGSSSQHSEEKLKIARNDENLVTKISMKDETVYNAYKSDTSEESLHDKLQYNAFITSSQDDDDEYEYYSRVEYDSVQATVKTQDAYVPFREEEIQRIDQSKKEKDLYDSIPDTDNNCEYKPKHNNPSASSSNNGSRHSLHSCSDKSFDRQRFELRRTKSSQSASKDTININIDSYSESKSDGGDNRSLADSQTPYLYRNSIDNFKPLTATSTNHAELRRPNRSQPASKNNESASHSDHDGVHQRSLVDSQTAYLYRNSINNFKPLTATSTNHAELRRPNSSQPASKNNESASHSDHDGVHQRSLADSQTAYLYRNSINNFKPLTATSTNHAELRRPNPSQPASKDNESASHSYNDEVHQRSLADSQTAYLYRNSIDNFKPLVTTRASSNKGRNSDSSISNDGEKGTSRIDSIKSFYRSSNSINIESSSISSASSQNATFDLNNETVSRAVAASSWRNTFFELNSGISGVGDTLLPSHFTVGHGTHHEQSIMDRNFEIQFNCESYNLPLSTIIEESSYATGDSCSTFSSKQMAGNSNSSIVSASSKRSVSSLPIVVPLINSNALVESKGNNPFTSSSYSGSRHSLHSCSDKSFDRQRFELRRTKSSQSASKDTININIDSYSESKSDGGDNRSLADSQTPYLYRNSIDNFKPLTATSTNHAELRRPNRSQPASKNNESASHSDHDEVHQRSLLDSQTAYLYRNSINNFKPLTATSTNHAELRRPNSSQPASKNNESASHSDNDGVHQRSLADSQTAYLYRNSINNFKPLTATSTNHAELRRPNSSQPASKNNESASHSDHDEVHQRSLADSQTAYLYRNSINNFKPLTATSTNHAELRRPNSSQPASKNNESASHSDNDGEKGTSRIDSIKSFYRSSNSINIESSSISSASSQNASFDLNNETVSRAVAAFSWRNTFFELNSGISGVGDTLLPSHFTVGHGTHHEQSMIDRNFQFSESLGEIQFNCESYNLPLSTIIEESSYATSDSCSTFSSKQMAGNSNSSIVSFFLKRSVSSLPIGVPLINSNPSLKKVPVADYNKDEDCTSILSAKEETVINDASSCPGEEKFASLLGQSLTAFMKSIEISRDPIEADFDRSDDDGSFMPWPSKQSSLELEDHNPIDDNLPSARQNDVLSTLEDESAALDESTEGESHCQRHCNKDQTHASNVRLTQAPDSSEQREIQTSENLIYQESRSESISGEVFENRSSHQKKIVMHLLSDHVTDERAEVDRHRKESILGTRVAHDGGKEGLSDGKDAGLDGSYCGNTTGSRIVNEILIDKCSRNSILCRQSDTSRSCKGLSDVGISEETLSVSASVASRMNQSDTEGENKDCMSYNNDNNNYHSDIKGSESNSPVRKNDFSSHCEDSHNVVPHDTSIASHESDCSVDSSTIGSKVSASEIYKFDVKDDIEAIRFCEEGPSPKLHTITNDVNVNSDIETFNCNEETSRQTLMMMHTEDSSNVPVTHEPSLSERIRGVIQEEPFIEDSDTVNIARNPQEIGLSDHTERMLAPNLELDQCAHSSNAIESTSALIKIERTPLLHEIRSAVIPPRQSGPPNYQLLRIAKDEGRNSSWQGNDNANFQKKRPTGRQGTVTHGGAELEASQSSSESSARVCS
jgi:protein required for attachment to host cells